MRKYYNHRITLSDDVEFPEFLDGFVAYITIIDDIGYFLIIDFYGNSQDVCNKLDPIASVNSPELPLEEIDEMVKGVIGLKPYTIDINSISDNLLQKWDSSKKSQPK